MEGEFYMQSSTFGRLYITQRIDLRGTYTCPKRGTLQYLKQKESNRHDLQNDSERVSAL